MKTIEVKETRKHFMQTISLLMNTIQTVEILLISMFNDNVALQYLFYSI